MSLLELRLEDLRCLQRVELELHPRFNLLVGPNGSGKTSGLEAIYLLGRGRSFRTRHTERLIRHEATGLTVFGELAGAISTSLGVAYGPEQGLSARINRQPIQSLAQLSEAFPVQVIDPGIHRLVEEGPSFRRRWLDWGVFHVEPGFVPRWTAYHRTLKQRNAALKQGTDTQPWDLELVPLGEALTQSRSQVLLALQPLWEDLLARLLEVPVNLKFARGWNQEHGLAESLALHASRDRERGITSVGPHRFDVQLRIDNRAAREVLSRGQQKLLGSAMALAMSRLVAQAGSKVPTLLLDDPAAELDSQHSAALLREVQKTEGQIVMTSLHPEQFPGAQDGHVFHVEQGRVKRL